MSTTTSRLGADIAPGAKKEIAAGLGSVLADTYTLYLKTHNFHWNVTGPRFRELHLMFEEGCVRFERTTEGVVFSE